MPVTPTGPLSTIFDHLRDTFAKSSTWQQIVDAQNPNEASAKARVLLASSGSDFPRILLGFGRSYRWTRDGNSFQSNGGLAALLEFLPDNQAASDHEKILGFQNQAGQIIADILSLVMARTPGVLEITDIEFTANEDVLISDTNIEYVAGEMEIYTTGLVLTP